MNKKMNFALCLIMYCFSLGGCFPILIGAGINAACKTSNAHEKQRELEAKEAYGKYRTEIQEKNLEPIPFEDWLREQINKDPQKAKEWTSLLKNKAKD